MTPDQVIELMKLLLSRGVLTIRSINYGFDGIYDIATVSSEYTIDTHIGTKVTSRIAILSSDYVYTNSGWTVRK